MTAGSSKNSSSDHNRSISLSIVDSSLLMAYEWAYVLVGALERGLSIASSSSLLLSPNFEAMTLT
jgi:hypothetical protein